MSPVAPWFPSALAFAEAFAMASLVSGLIYWLARHPSTFMRWLRLLSSGVAALAMLCLFVAFTRDGSGRHAVFVLLFGAGASAVQATIEGTLNGETLSARQRFARSFFCYFWNAFVAGCFAVFLLVAALSDDLQSWPALVVTVVSAVLNRFSEAVLGYVLGLLIAPLSISFYRRVFQSLALRPGIDRTLREDEFGR